MKVCVTFYWGVNVCFIVCCMDNSNVALNAWEMLEKGCNE